MIHKYLNRCQRTALICYRGYPYSRVTCAEFKVAFRARGRDRVPIVNCHCQLCAGNGHDDASIRQERITELDATGRQDRIVCLRDGTRQDRLLGWFLLETRFSDTSDRPRRLK